MLSRRRFLKGGLSALALGMSTCAYAPPEKRAVRDGETLESVLRHGIDLFCVRDYEGARSWLYSHKGAALPITHKAKSAYSVNFLYALSNIPGGTVFNGRLQAAGEELTGLLHALKNAPYHLEWMQDDLVPFFSVPEYAGYKQKCSSLRGRFQMFPFMLCLVEQDYVGAQTALDKALAGLSAQEKHDVNFTLQILADRAQRENRPDRHAHYVALYTRIK
jgi:hypothetical protein